MRELKAIQEFDLTHQNLIELYGVNEGLIISQALQEIKTLKEQVEITSNSMYFRYDLLKEAKGIIKTRLGHSPVCKSRLIGNWCNCSYREIQQFLDKTKDIV